MFVVYELKFLELDEAIAQTAEPQNIEQANVEGRTVVLAS